jgi:hypothetical protein
MSDKKRRMYGFIIGIAFGLPYSYISQFINVWMLSDIPLFDLPIGRVTAAILTTLALGALGVIVAWDEESFFGLIGGTLLLVVLGSVQAYINSSSSQAVTSFFLFLFTFLPRLIIYLPLAFLFRWALNNLDNSVPGYPRGLRRPLKVIAVLLTVAVIGGRFSMLAPEARQALQDANALVLEGISARDNGSNLPKPLLDVDGFSTYAKGPYTLEWSSDVDSLPVTRSVADFGITESLILVHFENGYLFGCAYTPPSRVPKCINVTRVR